MPNMKTLRPACVSNATKSCFVILHVAGLLLTLALGLPAANGAADTAKLFATPDEAVAALMVATSALDTNALRVIFGPATEDLQNPDRVQATNDLNKFGAALMVHRLAPISDTNLVLEVGDDFWPFPVPLVKSQGGWYFDTEAGKDELLNRRIGQNELATLKSVRATVDAQREYASRDHDGDGVLEYAQKLRSSAGKEDGLYWPPREYEELSPLGPLAAGAQAEGYSTEPLEDGVEAAPFHGYYFKILTRQGKHAPGGKYDYIINGNMIAGFALVAWPADYGNSGVMTFIVNQQGIVYQKDLGEGTDKAARKLKAYDPDPSWTLSRE
jgi:hypothetical protein